MKQQVTILVGVDYSDASIAALDRALHTVRASTQAKLVAILVLAPQPAAGAAGFQYPTDEVIESARQTLADLVDARAAKISPDVELETVALVCLGDIASELVTQAKDMQADLLVVGTHGRKGLGRMLLGSVAEEVVRAAHCSVLVVRPQADDSEGEGIQLQEAVDEGAPTAGGTHEVLVVSGPHLDGGSVVATLADDQSGRMFLCEFEAPDKVSVGPLGGAWAPRPSAEQRARVGSHALRMMVEQSSVFEGLFAEAARRARD